MDNTKLTEAVVGLTEDIGELRGEIGQIKGIVTNGLSSTVDGIDAKLDAFLENRFQTCPFAKVQAVVNEQDLRNLQRARLYWAVGGVLVAVLIGLPGWLTALGVL